MSGIACPEYISAFVQCAVCSVQCGPATPCFSHVYEHYSYGWAARHPSGARATHGGTHGQRAQHSITRQVLDWLVGSRSPACANER
jgi:hypothetical protein